MQNSRARLIVLQRLSESRLESTQKTTKTYQNYYHNNNNPHIMLVLNPYKHTLIQYNIQYITYCKTRKNDKTPRQLIHITTFIMIIQDRFRSYINTIIGSKLIQYYLFKNKGKLKMGSFWFTFQEIGFIVNWVYLNTMAFFFDPTKQSSQTGNPKLYILSLQDDIVSGFENGLQNQNCFELKLLLIISFIQRMQKQQSIMYNKNKKNTKASPQNCKKNIKYKFFKLNTLIWRFKQPSIT
eukprot:TRINITY_DN6183_c0_g1_i8.p1 TRINITY_DN6183_c0_g1~~TRINITY_DN6183_c0_g1_i8.p1  ORF type:complete len:239 (+),score=-12.10 TRINITY_DN6183_c0_g1_i8:2-718(+)